MAAALLGAAVAAGTSMYSANRQAKTAKTAANQGYEQYKAAVDQGINDSQGYYDSAQGYLDPYRKSGERSTKLLEDILGLNGQEAQNSALAMYQGSPSAQIMKDVNSEAVRRTIGSAAAQGLSNAGSTTESLARRLSDVNLSNYYNWEGTAKGLSSQGLQASMGMSQNAMSRGQGILGARSSIGSAAASATQQGANATNAAWQSGTTNLMNLLGRYSQTNWGRNGNSGNGWTTTTYNSSGQVI